MKTLGNPWKLLSHSIYMSEWIAFVKNFQSQNGCSYKDALKHASPLYREMKGSGMQGGKVNRLKKAGRWTDYSSGTVNTGMDLAKRGMDMFGGKVNRLKKAGRWTDYSADTVNTGMDLAKRGMDMFGGKVNRLKKAGRWTGFAGDTANTGLNLAGKAMALGALGGFGLKKHRKRKMSGQALLAAGY
jgi:hypothetical protein